MVKKQGEKYKCSECGLVVVIEEDCGCTSCALVCCDEPMKKVRMKAATKPAKSTKKTTAGKRKTPKNFFMPTL